MFSFAPLPCFDPTFVRFGAFARGRRWLGTGVAIVGLTSARAAEEPAAEFGQAIQLAPLVVQGKPLSISVHARTKGDRRYAEKFADEVVEVAYETLGDSTGKGLIIVGAKGEPHPIHLYRKFLDLARTGQLQPDLTAAAGEVDGMLQKWQEKLKITQDPEKPMDITFDTFVPALPLPVEGVTSKLYQLAWAEGFAEARVEKMLKSLRLADLARDDLSRYDWVFYLPPHSATGMVLKELLNQGMKAEKMGAFKRAAVRTAVFAFKPVINKAVEAMRKGMLFQGILQAESDWTDDDIKELTKAYARELLPDLKPGSGDERRRALAAIEKQQQANAEYAKDPFVPPARLGAFDAAGYAAGVGAYTDKPPEVTHRFKREGECFEWNFKDHPPRPFYPAGDRLLVNEDGSMTIQFLVDDRGVITGVEERWVRRRKTVSRLPGVLAPVATR